MNGPTPAATVQVGEDTYQIFMLDATKGYPLYCKLLSKVGGVLESGGAVKGESELAMRMLGKAMQSLDAELIGQLIAAFGSSSRLVGGDGKSQPVASVFQAHFAGKYGHMLGWLFECAKVNFADFLPPNMPVTLKGGLGLGTLFHSTPPQTSPGSSTAP